MKFAGFDWDEGNRAKCEKHGVLVVEIESMLFNAPTFFPDNSHSFGEERWQVIGQSEGGRWLFVAVTFRSLLDDVLVRPISARYMHAKEVRHYETRKNS